MFLPQKIEIFLTIQKLQLTGQNLGRVFNFRNGHVHATYFLYYRLKLPNLKLKTWHKQLLGFLPLDIALPVLPFSLRKKNKHLTELYLYLLFSMTQHKKISLSKPKRDQRRLGWYSRKQLRTFYDNFLGRGVSAKV